jgi:hypothetical protein
MDAKGWFSVDINAFPGGRPIAARPQKGSDVERIFA